ncbi:MAG: hypothetical protein MUP28_11175 [Candidatus Aminicenantes bacterium]|jgi:hypothetical protein|nr:hypothetical protein [Candidatus Aminicenantes bacterium]
MSDTIFAIVHLFVLLGVLGYAVLSIVRGNVARGGLILILLAVYYFLVLHKAVRKEIVRKRTK